MANETYLDEVWEKHTPIVRRFLDMHAIYEQIASEGEYIARSLLVNNKIQYALVTSRAKTLKSFLEKIDRKKYDDPLNEITDLAGVRIVYLYEDERSNLENIIENEFTVIEKLNEISDSDTNYFGYGALHYIVTLSEKYRGARYDTLKGIKFEIQVRTILQDAWALVAHYLVYKRETDIPTHIQRKLNRLVGLFETADEQFASIKNERQQYLLETVESIKSNHILNLEMNIDSLASYCEWKFSDKPAHQSDLSCFLSMDTTKNYKHIRDLNAVVDKSQKAINEYLDHVDDSYEAQFSSSLLNLAVATSNEEFYKKHSMSWSEVARQVIEKYKRW